MPKLAELREPFEARIAAGENPANAGMTFEYHCTSCDTTTYVSGKGGVLDGTCEPTCCCRNVHIHAMLGGQRIYLGTPLSIADCRDCKTPNAPASILTTQRSE